MKRAKDYAHWVGGSVRLRKPRTFPVDGATSLPKGRVLKVTSLTAKYMYLQTATCLHCHGHASFSIRIAQIDEYLRLRTRGRL